MTAADEKKLQKSLDHANALLEGANEDVQTLREGGFAAAQENTRLRADNAALTEKLATVTALLDQANEDVRSLREGGFAQARSIGELTQQVTEASLKLNLGSNVKLDYDPDTLQFGVMPPFNDWEDDHTGLIHVLWAAEHENLTLRGDASDIAYRILGSRWLAAYAHKAANTVSAG